MNAADLAIGGLTIGGLVAPGWCLARAARVPQSFLAGLVGGIVGMTCLLIGLDTAGVRLTGAAIGGAWGVVLGLAIIAARMIARRQPVAVSPAPPVSWREHWPLLVPLVPACVVVVYRACAQPLFGIDTIFRWHYLAERMFFHHGLDFYPPVSPRDFEIYGWPDGIAPTVSGVYFFAYALGGGARPLLTAPFVIAQYALLIAAVFFLGRRWFSERSGAFAAALVACSPLVAWATAMGQETGLTAIATVALLSYLPSTRAEETSGTLVFAALAAGLAALAREYGLVIPILGLALCLGRRLSLRATLLFAAVVAAAVLPWYLRNWLRTGNPFFNLDLAGLFPVNEVHNWLMQGYAVEFGWPSVKAEAIRQLIVNAAVALLGGIAGACLFPRRGAPLLITALAIISCWIASVAYTAAGFTYSLRVLNPALAIAAVLGGAALARGVPGRRHLAGVTAALTLFATDAALRSLVLPLNVYRVPPGAWLTVGGAVQEFHQRPIYREFVRVAGRERILVFGPAALLSSLGARTLPLWSPEVRFIFDPGQTPAKIAVRLRAAHIGFVLLNKGSANERFLARSAFFRDPAGSLVPVWADDDMILLQVHDQPAT